MRLRIPPGRAGRLWLRERLAAARKASDLLEHKRRELEAELQRVLTIAGRRERAWQEAAQAARRWLERIAGAGSERSLRLTVAMQTGSAEVRLEWRQIMGVRYPTDHEVRFPAEPRVQSLEGGAALVPALAAYRTAVEAAVAHAVANAAVTQIQADMLRTRRRLRALELRVIPAHERALWSLELQLDEKDREDAVAARWAADGAPPASGA